MCRQSNTNYLDLKLIKEFFKLNKILFPSFKSNGVWCFLGLLLAASVEQFLAYKVGLISGAFYEIFGKKDQDAFWVHVIYCLAILLAITVCKSVRVFMAKTLGVIWRKLLTKKMHDLYFDQVRFYQLTSLGK